MDHDRSKECLPENSCWSERDQFPINYSRDVLTQEVESAMSEASSSHCHPQIAKQKGETDPRRTLLIASIFCLVFMAGEAVGGILAHSLAILTDAAHMLTDFASFMISLVSVYVATRPATKRMSFGWHRAEILGALLSVLFIWVVTAILVYLAVMRIINSSYEIDAVVMLITSACAVVMNVIIGLILHKHGHSHGHSQDHQTEKSALASSISSSSHSYGSTEMDHKVVVKESKNINVRAAFLHVVGDLFQSVGVLVAAYIIYYKPEWKIADPICTFIFSVFVLISTIAILRDIIVILMEGVPKGIKFSQVKNSFFDIPGVKDVHNLRLWSLTLNKMALSVHLAIECASDSIHVLKTATKMIQKKFKIVETTIQIEVYEDAMIHCVHCKEPKD